MKGISAAGGTCTLLRLSSLALQTTYSYTHVYIAHIYVDMNLYMFTLHSTLGQGPVSNV